MANVYSSFGQAQFAALTDASAGPNVRQHGGQVHYLDIVKDYVSGALQATGDPLYLARLPKGARLIPSLCSIDYGDPGDALTGKVGFIYDDGTGDDDAFATALTLGNAAGRKNFIDSSGVGQGAAFATPVQFVDDAWVYVTWTTSTTPAAHKQTWHLAYTLG